MTLPKMENAPIVELVVGLFFEPIVELDLVLLGKYWGQRSAEYPGHAVHPAVHDQPRVVPYSQGQRIWLVSADDQFVVQLQADRFYFNWRKRGPAYPRFRDRGERHGLATKGLEEFDRFANFCKDELGERPSIQRLEVTKIDRVPYEDRADLFACVRLAKALETVWRSDSGELNVTFTEHVEGIDVLVRATNVIVGILGEAQGSALQVETRTSRAIDARPPMDLLDTLSEQANKMFEAIFTDEAIRRFKGGTVG
jgi:uncharacterized protein (TIGR04255 family)